MLSKALQAAAGNAGAAGSALYVDDVFSTYLYTGNGSTQTITNGIDLTGEGGLVWIKPRDIANSHILTDTVRGAAFPLIGTNNTNAQSSVNPYNFSFSGSGFAITSGSSQINQTNNTYASWTFRKAPKFFDVVTYTGTGSARTVAHNLGSVPGCIIIKKTSAASTAGWYTYHRSLDITGGASLLLNSTAAASVGATSIFNNTLATSTNFTVGGYTDVNASGQSFVAYLFAHDAGGFGADGSENVISCGSFTTDGSYNSSTTLGWEPQWVLVKSSSAAGGWFMFDNMRGMPVSGDNNWLYANLANAEVSSSVACRPNATGFTTFNLSANTTHVYIAIRRPMKPPESGTEVFAPVSWISGQPSFVTGFPVDMSIYQYRDGAGARNVSRLTNGQLSTNTTAAEGGISGSNLGTPWDMMTGWMRSDILNTRYIGWNFKRASGFMDVVCYTGTGSARTVNHNLTVAPEMIIVKRRDATSSWPVYVAAIGNTNRLTLQTAEMPASAITYWNSTSPTSSNFTVATNSNVNTSIGTYVAYLFATLPGVSKVGSYTGNGSSQTINCGFTSGARFVLIKRTDSTGDWYVWDTARGMVAGNDPYLLLNSTAAEVTNTDYIDTYSAGFEITSTAPAAINANGGSFIFLAIA